MDLKKLISSMAFGEKVKSHPWHSGYLEVALDALDFLRHSFTLHVEHKTGSVVVRNTSVSQCRKTEQPTHVIIEETERQRRLPSNVVSRTKWPVNACLRLTVSWYTRSRPSRLKRGCGNSRISTTRVSLW